MATTNILIIGCKYVGCKLARLYIKKINNQFEVWGIHHSNEKLPDNIHPIIGDLITSDQIRKVAKFIGYVFIQWQLLTEMNATFALSLSALVYRYLIVAIYMKMVIEFYATQYTP